MKRRKFLQHSNHAALGLGSLTTVNTLLNMRLINNAIAAPSADTEYKALVVLILNGGNDSYNMLAPAGAEYANYASVRAGVNLPEPGAGGRDELIPINPSNTPGRTFGLHGALPNLAQRFNDGRASFLANVGPLAQPTSITQYQNRSVSLPVSLFSHSSQVETWATGSPRDSSSTGWAGRLADRVRCFNPSNQVSMNLSLAGNQLALVGQQSFPFALRSTGSPELPTGNPFSQIATNSIQSMTEIEQRGLLSQAFNNESARAIDLSVRFNEAFETVNLDGFDTNNFQSSLQAVARTIGARDVLNQRRQIFVVTLGGFDNHGGILSSHRNLMSTLDAGLNSFWNGIESLEESTGLASDAVTLMTVSEFARTLRSNGSGTDHAWGGNVMIEGGAIDGGKIFGQYPNPDEFGIGRGLDVATNGRLLPTTSVDDYYADVALWMGVPTSEIFDVLPNLRNFHGASLNGPPIGLFS